MPRRAQQTPVLNDKAAVYILDRLMNERRIAPGEVARYLADLPAEIAAIEARLQFLRGATRSDARSPEKSQRIASPKREKRPNAGNGKALGGMYGGLIRRMPAAKQRQYKEIKRTRGIEAAIVAMRERAR